MFRFACQIALQTVVLFLVFSIAWPFYYLRATEWCWPTICAMIGAFAFLIARITRQPWWWQTIHLLFAPLLWIGLQLGITPNWYLGGFLLLLLIFRSAASERVPLYMSGTKTAVQIARLTPKKSRLIDLGAGIGSLLFPLFRLRPDLTLTGIDHAPLPWFLGGLRAQKNNIAWHWGDFWQHSLNPYQALYCFLSPDPMPELWCKASQEMYPKSLFVSKAFPIPGVIPESISIAQLPQDTLYTYRIPSGRED